LKGDLSFGAKRDLAKQRRRTSNSLEKSGNLAAHHITGKY